MKISKKALFSLVCIGLSCNASAEIFDFISKIKLKNALRKKIKLKNALRKIKKEVKEFDVHYKKNKKAGEDYTKFRKLEKDYDKISEKYRNLCNKYDKITENEFTEKLKLKKRKLKKLGEINNFRGSCFGDIINSNHFCALKNKHEKIIKGPLNDAVVTALKKPKLFKILNKKIENSSDIKSFFQDKVKLNIEQCLESMATECLCRNNYNTKNKKLENCLKGTLKFAKVIAKPKKVDRIINTLNKKVEEKINNHKQYGYTEKSYLKNFWESLTLFQ